MLPDVNHPAWRQVVTGERQVQSSKSAVNLLIQCSKMSYGRDPSPDNLNQLIAKLHRFFTRYETTFISEIAQIFQ
jgi:hypothetical protein